MKYKIPLFLLFTLLVSGCNKTDNCEDVLCFTPPSTFVFELLNKDSKENVFSINAFNSSLIDVLDLEDSASVEFEYFTQDSLNLILIHTIGWKTELIDYSIRHADTNVFRLHVDVERVYENCCSFSRYNDIQILDAEFIYDKERGLHKIFLDADRPVH